MPADAYNNYLQGDTSGATNNGFWSVFDGVLPGFSKGIGEGLYKVGANVFPKYVSDQLSTQSNNQMDRVLFDPNKAQPRVDQTAQFNTTTDLSIKEIALIGALVIAGVFVAIKL